MFSKKIRVRNKKKPLGIGFVGLLLFVLNACGNDTGKETLSPKPSPDSLAATSGITTPHPVTDTTRKTYRWYCAQCHGATIVRGQLDIRHGGADAMEHEP